MNQVFIDKLKLFLLSETNVKPEVNKLNIIN